MFYKITTTILLITIKLLAQDLTGSVFLGWEDACTNTILHLACTFNNAEIAIALIEDGENLLIVKPKLDLIAK